MERSQEVSPKPWQNECNTVRGFCRNLEDYGALPQGFHHYVPNPSISEDDERRDESIDGDRGRKITEYLRKYKRGSERYVWWELIWTTTMRIGDGHSIDEDDIDRENKQIQLRHRPDQVTELKNGEGMGSEGGERNDVGDMGMSLGVTGNAMRLSRIKPEQAAQLSTRICRLSFRSLRINSRYIYSARSVVTTNS